MNFFNVYAPATREQRVSGVPSLKRSRDSRHVRDIGELGRIGLGGTGFG